VLRTIVEDKIPDATAARGNQLMGLLDEFAASGSSGSQCIGDVRGRGLAIGVDLVTDRASKARAVDLARKTVYRAWQLGAVVYYVGGNVLEVTPPMTISATEIDQAAALLTTAIADAAAGAVTDEMVAPYAGW
jgi:4-aminobutyrate aminotransferase